MAGGMTPGGHETLAQRVANTRARQGHGTSDLHGQRPAGWFPGADSVPEPVETAPPVRHCWYDGPHGRQPALLLGWRNTGGHYDGRIAVAAQEPGVGWGIVEMWVSAAMLSPA
ncbi:hypothetical protein [Nocardioides xinjiangensis]|uniref:hypothetical protein n=1 Tax=Nocardioides xinjiangensis TaxID=2817376 RepID=UPI001B305D60|nr:MULTISPECIES: hypothetical protein [unclassified Nocardioides]